MRHYKDHITPHRTLTRNLHGQDYFVGDIHGQYSHLMTLLQDCAFDPAVDRLIAVGDLIDRGDENVEVLALLLQPWFYSVLGNHEVMLLEWILGNAPHYYRMQVMNGGHWLAQEEDATLRQLAERLLKFCPLTFTVDTAGGRVGVCHTDPLNNDWSSMQRLTPDAFNAELASLWSRQRYQQIKQGKHVAVIANIDYVVSGHVACDRPVWAGNQVFIDTRFRGGALTVKSLPMLMEALPAPI